MQFYDELATSTGFDIEGATTGAWGGRVGATGPTDELKAFQADASRAFDMLLELARGMAQPDDPSVPNEGASNFVLYELAQGLCYMTTYYGRRTKEQLRLATAKLRQMHREFDGSEIADVELSRQVAKISYLRERLRFWAALYRQWAERNYPSAARALHDAGMSWIETSYRQDGRGQSPARRVTATAAVAREVAEQSRRRSVELPAYMAGWTDALPYRDSEEAA